MCPSPLSSSPKAFTRSCPRPCPPHRERGKGGDGGGGGGVSYPGVPPCPAPGTCCEELHGVREGRVEAVLLGHQLGQVLLLLHRLGAAAPGHAGAGCRRRRPPRRPPALAGRPAAGRCPAPLPRRGAALGRPERRLRLPLTPRWGRSPAAGAVPRLAAAFIGPAPPSRQSAPLARRRPLTRGAERDAPLPTPPPPTPHWWVRPARRGPGREARSPLAAARAGGPG